jgi:hypothetical protein
MTETSHVTENDNVVTDALSRWISYAVRLLNITTTGEDTTLCVGDLGSTSQHLSHDDSSPVDYSEEVVENLTLPSPPKIGVDDYTTSSFVTADLEVSIFSDVYPKCSDF